MDKKKAKSVELWADNDWYNMLTLRELKMVMSASLTENIFHYSKAACFDKKPRKVRITVKEI